MECCGLGTNLVLPIEAIDLKLRFHLGGFCRQGGGGEGTAPHGRALVHQNVDESFPIAPGA